MQNISHNILKWLHNWQLAEKCSDFINFSMLFVYYHGNSLYKPRFHALCFYHEICMSDIEKLSTSSYYLQNGPNLIKGPETSSGTLNFIFKHSIIFQTILTRQFAGIILPRFKPGLGRRGRCVKHWSRTPADPGSIPGAGDKNKRLISLPCNIRRCAPRGSHIT